LTEEYARVLAAAPQLRLLHTLEVERVAPARGAGLLRAPHEDVSLLGTLLGSPYVGNVRSFELSGCYWPPAGTDLELLFDPFWLPRLTHLRLRGSTEGNRFCESLVGSGMLKRLQTLELRGFGITDHGALALAGCPDLARLDVLVLDHNFISETGLRALRATKVHFRAQARPSPPYNPDERYDDDWE
jgi:hypothetical protein